MLLTPGIAIERLRALERVLALIKTYDPPEEVTERWIYLASAYYWMAEIRRSYDLALRWMTWCEHSRQLPNQLYTAYAWLAWVHASQGALPEAEQALEQALASMAAAALPEASDLLLYIRGLLAVQQEDYSGAEQTFQALLANPQNSDDNRISCAPLLSLICLGTGKKYEAHLYIEKWQDYLTKLPTGTLPTLPIMLALALLVMALGEQTQAPELYHNLLPFQGYYCWFLVDRVLGDLATFFGDVNAAEMHLARAEAIAHREGLLPELARTLLGRANLELARGKEGNITQAEAHLREALALFEKLAMHKSARELRSRLGHLSDQPGKLKVSPLPADLTRREVEILRLVAEGKSNNQIARLLNLSEKTVANHLTIIFHKTASENRAAAAAFAIRHGLV
jgi:DNA-binding CsgD family transcriptional regulator